MSEQAKRRLVSALVSLAKTTRGGYEGLRGSALSGGKRKSAGSLSGGSLSGGAKRRVGRRRTAGSLGVVNLSTTGAGLSGGRRKRKASGTSGGRKQTSPWISHVKKYARDHNLTYGESLKKARASYRG